MRQLKLLLYQLTLENVSLVVFSVILKSRNWDSENLRIQDWLKWPGFWDPEITHEAWMLQILPPADTTCCKEFHSITDLHILRYTELDDIQKPILTAMMPAINLSPNTVLECMKWMAIGVSSDINDMKRCVYPSILCPPDQPIRQPAGMIDSR